MGYKWNNYPTQANDQAEFRDRFFRGLYFSLNAGGIVGVFDFFNLIVVVTSVSILLALSATAVSMIAYGLLGYTSHVYDAFGQQKLNMKRLHAKIAGQALIAGKVWRELITEDIHTKVGVEQLTEAFIKQGYNAEDAQELAVALLSSKHDDEDPGIEALNEMLDTADRYVSVQDESESTKSAERV